MGHYTILLGTSLASFEVYETYSDALYNARRVYFFDISLKKEWLTNPEESFVVNGCHCCGAKLQKMKLGICNDSPLYIQEVNFHTSKPAAQYAVHEPFDTLWYLKPKTIHVHLKQQENRFIDIEMSPTDTFDSFLKALSKKDIKLVSLLTYTYKGRRLHTIIGLYEYLADECIVTGSVQTLPPVYYDPIL